MNDSKAFSQAQFDTVNPGWLQLFTVRILKWVATSDIQENKRYILNCFSAPLLIMHVLIL